MPYYIPGVLILILHVLFHLTHRKILRGNYYNPRYIGSILRFREVSKFAQEHIDSAGGMNM